MTRKSQKKSGEARKKPHQPAGCQAQIGRKARKREKQVRAEMSIGAEL